MCKLLIVDGSNLLFQMFYGMPSRIVNQQGKAIQGTLGFVGALLKIIRMVSPTHVAVLFDGECTNPRSTVDPSYKSNRPDLSLIPEEDTPFSQLPDIYLALDHLNILHKETADCEVDDWIAGYAATLVDRMNLVIASQDSDFFQLINDRVFVLRYRGKQSVICDQAYIHDKLGIASGQYAAYKSLTGDCSDNIPGVHKVGPKTAAALIRQFGDLDTLLKESERIEKPSVRSAVQQNIERIRTNYSLIALNGTAALPFSLQELRYHDTGMTTIEVLKAIGLR